MKEEFDHRSDNLLKVLMKTFTKNLELRSEIRDKIKETKGGEKLSWIKKFNSLFINKWGKKKK